MTVQAADPTTPQTSHGPRTPAGRALLAWSESDALPLEGFATVGDAIIAIEAQAVGEAVALLRTVAFLFDGVMALLRKIAEGEG